jgi:hypothetical protein
MTHYKIYRRAQVFQQENVRKNIEYKLDLAMFFQTCGCIRAARNGTMDKIFLNTQRQLYDEIERIFKNKSFDNL